MRKEFKIKFKNKNELDYYGKDNLKTEIVKIINEVDNKYILKPDGCHRNVANLFGFEDSDKMTEKINRENISSLVEYVDVLIDNIFTQAKDKDSFIGWIFNNSFEFTVSHIEDYGIEFSFISIYNNGNGSGSGNSCTFEIIDKPKYDNVISQLDEMKLSESFKNAYIEFFDSGQNCDLDISIANDYFKEVILEEINDFLKYDDKIKEYKNYKTLMRNNFKEDLENMLKKNGRTYDLCDAIDISYRTDVATAYNVIIDEVPCKEGEAYINEDRAQVKFLGEIIKTISKSTYTVYEIN